MVTEKNIIKKMQIEVQAPSVAIGTQLKDKIGDFFKDEIIPEMDVELEVLAKQFPERIVRFDQIKLDLSLTESFTLRELKPLLIKQLKEQISKADNTAYAINFTHSQLLSTSKNESDAFLFFIETGTYPWWYDSKKVFTIALFQKMLEIPSFSEELRQKLKQKHIQKRIIFQFDFEMIEAIYHVLAERKGIQHLSKTVSQSLEFQSLKVPFWTAVFDYSITRKDVSLLQKLDVIVSSNSKKSKKIKSKKYQVETSIMKETSKLFTYISELLNLGIVLIKTKQKNIRLSVDKNTSPSASKKLNDATLKSIESLTVTYNLVDSKPIEDEHIDIENAHIKALSKASEEGILIDNAGLVLLHPYIPQLFEQMGFLSEDSEEKKKKTIHPKKIARAIHTLHYLACKKEHPYEHELVVEKYLCGFPLGHSLERMITLTNEEKTHCTSLLSAVLTHWKALKTNHIELLQNEFLAREGKLFIDKTSEKIYVQRKAQDILLDQLPWNLTLAKLPWKQNIIHIEW